MGRDEVHIKSLLDLNKKHAQEAHARLQSVLHESNALYRLAQDNSKLIFGAKSNLKRCNKVLRRLLSAIKGAESAEKAIKARIKQTISCREESFSAVLVGDVHILVNDNKLATFDFSHLGKLSGELLGIDSNIQDLEFMAIEIEEAVNKNREVLFEDNYKSDKHRESIDKDDRLSEKDLFWFSRDETSVSIIDTTEERERWYYKKKRYKMHRNLAILFAVVSLLGLIAFAVLYYTRNS